MGMLWRGTHKFRGNVQFQGGVMGVFPSLGNGKTYYVDYLRGKDENSGTDPNWPKKTIAAAFSLVYGTQTDIQNDYIFVFASKDQDAAATIKPAGNAQAHWHLISTSNPQCTFGVVLRTTSDTDSCITLEDGCGLESEIAGFNFGGGATAVGGISLSQIHGLWVHNCTFGHSFCGDTPAYGIMKPDQTNNENCLIEDCYFYGNANYSSGKIATDGICMNGPTPAKNLIIRDNIFLGIPGKAINIDSLGGIIVGNKISMDADTAGSAITLGTYSYGCWVDENSANFGDTDAATGPPWLDNSAGGADANNWGCNWEGNAPGFPA